VVVRFEDDVCTVSLGATAEPLWRRGYRQEVSTDKKVRKQEKKKKRGRPHARALAPAAGLWQAAARLRLRIF